MDDHEITHYRKDKRGEMFLQISAASLIGMLSVAGVMEGSWVYFFWAVLVSYFWGEAMFAREPRRYRHAGSRRIMFVMQGAMIIFVVSLITVVWINPQLLWERLLPPTPVPTFDPFGPTPTPQPLVTPTVQGFLHYLTVFR